MARGSLLRVLALVSLAFVLLPGARVTGANGFPTMGTVVGTDAVNIRSCSDTSCDVVAVASLGERLRVTGRPEGDFLPVIYQGTAGYAYSLYVQMDGAPTPYLSQGTAGCNRVALLFDVGIGDTPDTAILDTLEQDGVAATMFVMGWWAPDHPALLHRMMADGFPIGSHGNSAQELPDLSDDQIVAEIHDAAAAIQEATGSPPGPWYTPYAAAIDERVRGIIAANGYLPVGWTIGAPDYGPDATADAVYHRVVDNVSDGAIVELHLDGPASATSTGEALPRIIQTLRDWGYHFVTIPQMADPCS